MTIGRHNTEERKKKMADGEECVRREEYTKYILLPQLQMLQQSTISSFFYIYIIINFGIETSLPEYSGMKKKKNQIGKTKYR